MTDWNAVNAFMAQVVPWPGSEEPGYVNLHYSMVNARKPNDPLLKGMGWPFRDLSTFIGRASWVNGTTNFKDVWFCTSLQSAMKSNTKGKPKAVRLAANAIGMKAIWIDMDVGPNDPKKYPTIEEALKTAIWFREKVGLPPFSAIVGSGTGIHVYWISDAALTPAEWRAYAWGLKALLVAEGIRCDAGLTTDAARLLRVPGTFNHKTNPPRPVQLFNVPLVTYNFVSALSFLITIPSEQVTPQAALTKSTLFADGADINSFKKPPAIRVDGPDLHAGIDKHAGDNLLKAEPILKQCGFLRDALMSGGKSYDNPLWNLSVLCSTFMENGNAIAHALSQGHATYSAADTQALYDRKVADRADRNIGYPSCATIQGAGCQSCATCPLLAKGKSPLNIRPAVTATVTPPGAIPNNQTPGGMGLMLPIGYDLDDRGYICKVIEYEATDGSESLPPKYLQLFLSKLTDPWAQADPDCINFTSTVDKGKTYQASIKHEEMQGSMDFGRVLARNKVKTFPDNKKYLEHFMVSWLAKLHEAASAQQSLPFGWYEEGGSRRGFVYNGMIFKDDGSEHHCGVGDPKLRKIFHTMGDAQPWFDACKIITQRQQPELDAIIALSFSAPLTALVGKNAVTMCAYGESGAAKSAAYSVGIGVWGHPKLGKGTSHSTFNGIMHKMGELRNLPLYWDEIKDPKAQEAVFNFIYNASDGVEKDRQKSDLTAADKGSWQTQMMMAANISFTDFVMKKDPSHVAGVSRVLEYRVLKREVGPGMISQTDADVAIDKIQQHHGHMGLRYAKYLAVNLEQVTKDTIASCKQVEQDLGNSAEERLWVTLVGTLLVGARIANELGCEIGLPALKDFLYRTYIENRNKRNNMMAVSGKRETTEGIMTDYFGHVMANDQMLYTYGMPAGPGKPAAVTVLKGPNATRNPAGTVSVRWDTESRKLFVSKQHLEAWMAEKNVGVGTCFSSLQSEYGMKFERRVRLAGGTTYDAGRATVLVFKINGPDHDFYEMLYKWTPLEKRPTPEDPTPSHGVDTGLTPVDNVIEFVKGAMRQ